MSLPGISTIRSTSPRGPKILASFIWGSIGVSEWWRRHQRRNFLVIGQRDRVFHHRSRKDVDLVALGLEGLDQRVHLQGIGETCFDFGSPAQGDSPFSGGPAEVSTTATLTPATERRPVVRRRDPAAGIGPSNQQEYSRSQDEVGGRGR